MTKPNGALSINYIEEFMFMVDETGKSFFGLWGRHPGEIRISSPIGTYLVLRVGMVPIIPRNPGMECANQNFDVKK